MIFCETTDPVVTIPFSLLVLLIGMLVIFFALAIIVCVVLGYSGIFRALDRLKKEKPAPAAAESAPASTPAEEMAADNDEIVAAITAAVYAVLSAESEDGDVPPFRVKSILAIK